MIAYTEQLKDEVREVYKLQLLAYYMGQIKKPKLPKILGGKGD